jgi:hypothetical protein
MLNKTSLVVGVAAFLLGLALLSNDVYLYRIAGATGASGGVRAESIMALKCRAIISLLFCILMICAIIPSALRVSNGKYRNPPPTQKSSVSKC